MESFISQAGEWLQAIAIVVFALTILATAVVRMTPTKSDDLALKSWSAKLLKLVSYLPTWGINPRTKQLEEWLKEQEENESYDSDQAS